MLTGVIFAAIVIAWAGYLVPTALRRHDQASKARSIDRFSSAMRVLARRTTTAGGRVIVAPARSTARVLGPDPVEHPEPAVERVRPSRAALQAAAARRRRVLIGLLSLAIVVLVVSLVGVLPMWSILLPLTVVAVFLAAARRSVRRASDDYWLEVDGQPASASNLVRRTVARVDAATSAASEAGDAEPTLGLSRRDLAAAVKKAPVADEPQRMVAVTVKTAEGGSLWDPLPITLPSYVGAPAAKRTMRTIDLGAPDTWSSGHETAAGAAAEGSAAAEAAGADGSSEATVEAADSGEAQVVNG